MGTPATPDDHALLRQPPLRPPARSPWRVALYGGCGCLAAVGIALTVAVALNARAIKDGLRTASGAMGELFKVQRAVVAHTRTPEVHVQWHRAFSGPKQATTLVVRVTNSPLLADVELEAAEPQAREIARIARDALPEASKRSPIAVTLARRTGIGVNFTNSRSFPFAPDELDVGR